MITNRPFPTRIAGLLLAAALVMSGCSDDGDDGATGTTTTEAAAGATTTTVAEAQTLRLVVTNDDGIGAEGIDVLVKALQELPDVEVHVVAPAENQSGTSDKTTPEGAAYDDGATVSGVEGTAVRGFPADTVIVALDELKLEPHLVVSGINEGQNAGPIGAISGTVGAARTAIRRGIPAIALSGGAIEPHGYELAAQIAVEWITENREALLAGEMPTDHVVSVNIPVCSAGEVKELLEVPPATAPPAGNEGRVFVTDCTADAPEPVDDMTALVAGHPSMSKVPAEL